MFKHLLFAVFALPFFLPASSAIAQDTKRSITDLGNNIYRFQDNMHYSVFIVGKQGLLMTDPISSDAATWLRKEIRQRFGDLPIKYVIYSHNHLDHVAGGEVFRDAGTLFIAHEKAAEDLKRNRAQTVIPTTTFSDRMEIDFEGRRIALQYYGPNNGAGNISMYVTDAKFLFVVDWIILKRLPFKEMYYYDFEGSIASLKQVLQVDFDKVAPGHSVVGTKNDVRENLAYLEDLRDAVLKGMNEGRTLEQMQREIKLPRYAAFANYEEWLPLNIKGAYEQLARVSGRYGQEK
ncbi:MAG: MBL fold metallo-hydrolase [Oxalicibacterium faecigallinarum]|uniref:MBL fold metallo-hydrolase n=1 Tax=Oxalicibacterium faecigallinarum TaxID=573741 RepID=UPI002809DC99|nr:MBL fold metallo-hydrolase [Oxalicibacterium faecigallinarum]MDQ7968299.1 MBL fold metallo-hydrolase [Oxalicibacterium faecigallinarum]